MKDISGCSDSKAWSFREDLPGRFNETDILRRHWSRVINCFREEIFPPFEVIIHPSSTCNLRCLWCIGDYVPVTARRNDGTQEVLEASKRNEQRIPDLLSIPQNMMRVVEGIVSYQKPDANEQDEKGEQKIQRVENVSFSGLIGEPLVSKNAVMSAMTYLVDKDIRTGMYTNGVLMDDSTHEVIVRTAYLHMSLDAGSASTYGLLKCGGILRERSFDLAIHNLKNLIHRRQCTPGTSLEVNASFILLPENYKEIYMAAALLKNIGVGTLRIKHDISGNRRLNVKQSEEAKGLIDKIRHDLTDSTFNLIEIHRIEGDMAQTRNFSRCRITELMAAVGSDGCVYPCNYHPRPQGATLGSAIDVPFQQIWEGEVRKTIRKNLPDICPKVCDPFKGRANMMLEYVGRIYKEKGLEGIQELKNNFLDE